MNTVSTQPSCSTQHQIMALETLGLLSWEERGVHCSGWSTSSCYHFSHGKGPWKRKYMVSVAHFSKNTDCAVWKRNFSFDPSPQHLQDCVWKENSSSGIPQCFRWCVLLSIVAIHECRSCHLFRFNEANFNKGVWWCLVCDGLLHSKNVNLILRKQRNGPA